MKLTLYRALAGAATLAVVAAACSSEPPFAPRPAIRLETREVYSAQQAWSGFHTPTRLLITSPGEWATVWATLHENVTPQPALPVIDFGSNVLLLAAMGTRPTGGYSVTIEEVRAYEGIFYVTVRERSPGRSCGTYDAITQPVHVLETSRQAAAARFTVRTATHSCN
jgi:hypothetical protein